MDDVEERVAYLEGKFEVQGVMINEVRETTARIERRFDQLESRLDQRFAAIDQRFGSIDRRLDSLDTKVGRHFVVLVSLLVTTLIAIIGGMSGVIAAILQR